MAANQFQLAEAFTTLTVDDAKMKMQLKGAKKKVIDLGATMQAVSRTAQLFLAGGVAGIGLLVKEASDAQETIGMFETVFRDQSEEVKRWAETFGEATGRSKNDLMGFAAGLQDTFVPLGFARGEAASLSKQITELGVDLGSFKNMGATEAVDRLTGALVGNHENVRKFGVILNESTIKAELAALGMDKLTGKALEQAKVRARMNIILRDTTDAQGDAEKTAGSAANQMVKLKADFKDARIEMGEKFLPVAMDLVKWLSDMIEKFNNLSDAEKQQIADWIVLAVKVAAFIVVGNQLTRTIGVAIKAFQLLRLAMLANPYLLIAAGIAAVAVSMNMLGEAHDDGTKSAKNYLAQQEKAIGIAERRAEAEKKVADSLAEVSKLQNKASSDMKKASDAFDAIQKKEDAAMAKKAEKGFSETGKIEIERQKAIAAAEEALNQRVASHTGLKEQARKADEDFEVAKKKADEARAVFEDLSFSVATKQGMLATEAKEEAEKNFFESTGGKIGRAFASSEAKRSNLFSELGEEFGAEDRRKKEMAALEMGVAEVALKKQVLDAAIKEASNAEETAKAAADAVKNIRDESAELERKLLTAYDASEQFIEQESQRFAEDFLGLFGGAEKEEKRLGEFASIQRMGIENLGDALQQRRDEKENKKIKLDEDRNKQLKKLNETAEKNLEKDSPIRFGP